MASSASRGGDRMVHQDYIARIRYSNALPPPPNPPKLLDIPNTGLASGQYTNPGFASRLARDQPLNIEADAELGMPLDLVGMPGIFDGDESSIQAPLNLPVPHPHDRALLRPLSTLGKPKFTESGVSFLRRTEYISSHQSRSRFEPTTSNSLIKNTGGRTAKPAKDLNRESLENVKEAIEKGFQAAAALVKPGGPRSKHPSNRNATLVDSKLLLPDLDAFTDAGGYITIKFLTQPVPPSSTYDIRLETSILRPIEPTQAELEARQEAKEAYERDPERNPPPNESIEYELFLTENAEQAVNFKRKFDTLDPERDSDSLYTTKNASDEGCFRFKRLRAYEIAQQLGNVNDKYDEEVLIAQHDGKDGVRQKAAYYYPILQRTSIRPQRRKNINKNKMQFSQQSIGEEESRDTDFVDTRVEEPSEDTKAARDVFRTHPYGIDEPAEDEEDAEGEVAPAAEKNDEEQEEGANSD